MKKILKIFAAALMSFFASISTCSYSLHALLSGDAEKCKHIQQLTQMRRFSLNQIKLAHEQCDNIQNFLEEKNFTENGETLQGLITSFRMSMMHVNIWSNGFQNALKNAFKDNCITESDVKQLAESELSERKKIDSRFSEIAELLNKAKKNRHQA